MRTILTISWPRRRFCERARTAACPVALAQTARTLGSVVERRFHDPESMVGISADELLAMKPDGWLVRPHPPGHEGFRMISPGKLPGGYGSISWHGATPGYVRFQDRPDPRLFVLNEGLEAPSFADLVRSWLGEYPADPSTAAQAIAQLGEATEHLVGNGCAVVFEDPLEGEVLALLPRQAAVAAIRDPDNWWRSETAEQAESVFLLNVTDLGRKNLARAATPWSRRVWRRRS